MHCQSLVGLLRLASERVLAPAAVDGLCAPEGEGATDHTAAEGPRPPSS